MGESQNKLVPRSGEQDGTKWSRFRQIVIDLDGEDPGASPYAGWSKKEVESYIPLGETLLSIKAERAKSIS